MARKNTSSPIPKEPIISVEEGFAILQELRKEAEAFDPDTTSDQRIETWFTSVKDCIVDTFGEDSGYLNTWFGPMQMVVARGGSGQSDRARLMDRFKKRSSALDAIIEATEGQIRRAALRSQQTTPTAGVTVSRPESDQKKVFIVHGRDDGLKETCARFLELLGLEPVILHEQPNGGMTLVEKFEKHAMTGYALILLTGDDVGGLNDGSPQHSRARQNVIYEMGFFAGAIGRSRVCALYEAGVEMPSDLGGLAVYSIDPAGAWKFLVARELKAAGLHADLNKLAI